MAFRATSWRIVNGSLVPLSEPGQCSGEIIFLTNRNTAVVMVTRNRATQNELSMNRFASNTERLGKDASSQTHLDCPFVDGC
ncbi:hypothetical protein AB1N83_007369 [Pleurotus pulmonarius]